MTLLFLPWGPAAEPCPGCGSDYAPCAAYESVPVAASFRPYAAAFMNWRACWDCDTNAFDLEIGIGPACVAGEDLLCDRLHVAEEIARIRLSRGLRPWYADIHFDVTDVNYTAATLDLPWLHYHYFGLFDWCDEYMQRLSRFADTVIPFLCESALAICSHAWPLRRPYGGS